MWWVLTQHDWYRHYGDLDYLNEQRSYLIRLLQQLAEHVGPDGKHSAPNPFLDWPSSTNEQAVQAGIHALFTLTMEAGAKLCSVLGEQEAAEMCQIAEKKFTKRCAFT